MSFRITCKCGAVMPPERLIRRPTRQDPEGVRRLRRSIEGRHQAGKGVGEDRRPHVSRKNRHQERAVKPTAATAAVQRAARACGNARETDDNRLPLLDRSARATNDPSPHGIDRGTHTEDRR